MSRLFDELRRELDEEDEDEKRNRSGKGNSKVNKKS